MFDTRERFSGRHASGAGLLAMLGEARGLLKEAGARLDPDALDDPTVVRAVHDELVAIGKLVDGARMRLARRIHQTNAWKGSGDASAAAYLARTAGTTGAAARDLLDTSMRLPDAPATDAAARRGQVSTGQAHAITDAAHSDADAEAGLLARAAATPLSGLREEARRVKAAADPNPEATARRVHRNRRVRRWNDAEGAYNLHLRTTALAGAHIDATVQPLLDHLFTVARRQGRREPIDAYAADALTALITGHHPTTPHPEPDERAAAGEPAAGEPAPDDGSDPHTSTHPTGHDGHD